MKRVVVINVPDDMTNEQIVDALKEWNVEEILVDVKYLRSPDRPYVTLPRTWQTLWHRADEPPPQA